MTDHGTLGGIPEHLQVCKKANIKPIVGMEAYFAPDRFVKDKEHRKNWHLLLIAKNYQGFKNLIKLQSYSHTEGFYHKPRVDWGLLEQYSEGIICSSACVSGYLPHLIQEGDTNGVHECIERHLSIFGEENYRFEIMPHDFPAQTLVNITLSDLAQTYNIPLLATGDSHYPYEDWKDTQDVILMIATGQTKAKREKKREAGEDVYEIDAALHMFSEDEMYERFAKAHPSLTKQTVKSAIEESNLLAERIEEFGLDTTVKMPKVTKGPKEAEDILKKWAYEGLDRVGKRLDETYIKRFETELEVMKKLNVLDYLVLVARMVRWARGQGIRISSGRGSVSGSLTAYLTKITTIDPIAHELSFERFLNENRKGLPDIDLDFQSDRIPEVLEWLGKEIGEDNIAHIGSYGVYHPKMALKDSARVLNVPFDKINYITKLIPDASDVGGSANVPPLETLRSENDEIKKFASEYPEVWKHATRIEGNIKQLGKHPAGILVTNEPIIEHVPLIKGKSNIVTAWTDSANFPVISILNLLKIDVLSLDGLTNQGKTIKMIEETYGEKIDLDDLEITRNPEASEDEILEIFRKGLTLGIFQFGGSRGLINYCKHVKPNRFEDLIAINALYRPGGLEGGDAFKYGDLKKGKIPVKYWHPSVEPILNKTYGILCVAEGEKIFLGDGTHKNIEEINMGDEITSFDVVTKKNLNNTTRGCGPTRKGKGVILSLTDGSQTILTKDHKVLTDKGYVEAQCLNPETDLVATPCNLKIEKETPINETWLGEGKYISYLLGNMVGDGCLTGLGTCISTGTQRNTLAIEEFITNNLPGLLTNKYKHGRTWYLGLSVSNKSSFSKARRSRFLAYQDSIGIRKHCKKKNIPDVIKTGTKEEQAYFLAGLFDADGDFSSWLKLTSESKNLLFDVKRLLLNFNITSSIVKNRLYVANTKLAFKIIGDKTLVIKWGKLSSGRYDRAKLIRAQAIRDEWENSGLAQRKFAKQKNVSRSILSPFRGNQRFVCEGHLANDTDISYRRIKNIEETKEEVQFYGMSVESTHNFCAGGIIVKNCYQEQQQQIAEALGNFSPSDADDMRKATSKIYRMGKVKAQEFMKPYKEKWDKGCNENGLNQEESDYVWERMLAFASYAFNRNHSASYASEAYKDAYLKVNFPAPFYASLLSHEPEEKAEEIIREAKHFGVSVMPPDVNDSGKDFTVVEDKLLYGLLKIKYVGESAIEKILCNRPYSSLEDFNERCTANKRVKEYLEMSGSLDSLGARKDLSAKEKQALEQESLKVILSGIENPNKYSDLIKSRCNTESDFERMNSGAVLTVGGQIESVKEHAIKSGYNKGEFMGYFDIAFEDDNFSCVAFKDNWEKYREKLRPGNIIVLSGKKSDRDQVILNQLIEAEKLQEAIDKN